MQTQTNIYVCYQLDAGEIICEDFVVDIEPQYTDTVFFTLSGDFSSCGYHMVKAWTI